MTKPKEKWTIPSPSQKKNRPYHNQTKRKKKQKISLQNQRKKTIS